MRNSGYRQNTGHTQGGNHAQGSMRAQGGNHAQRSTRAQSGNYVHGSAVRKPDVVKEVQREPKKKLSNTARKNREKAEHMNAGYVFFLSIALIATGWILVNYISLQSDITNSIKHISRLESELNDLRLANDEEYNRITSSIDLEEIRRIAIQELGMQYAEEGQIVFFESETRDYVKQMSEIPE
ncbi:MAG: cell division protein FtsL [Muribaculaceae bacterium]|nr:cell division protein FtsL [Muribaculaceae bacterium]